METGLLLHVFTTSAILAAKISAPVLLAALVVGLAISLFQALTQINESTLAFLPKVVVMSLVLWLTMPWMVRQLVSFTSFVFQLASETTRS